jgi:hypothetical protein
MTRHETAFETELPEDARSLTILNVSGHSTLTWTPANDTVMRELIAKKLQQGFVFWILKPRAGGLLGERRVRLKDIAEAMDARKLSMDDEDFARLVSEGCASLVATTPERTNLEGAEISRDPAVIAASTAVAHRQMTGG